MTAWDNWMEKAGNVRMRGNTTIAGDEMKSCLVGGFFKKSAKFCRSVKGGAGSCNCTKTRCLPVLLLKERGGGRSLQVKNIRNSEIFFDKNLII
jgi:hypothetical protein